MSGFFVEIGAADFDTLYPLCQNGWGGIVVEPMPQFHDALRAMFAQYADRVFVIPAAVSYRNGTIEMANATGDDWARGISHIVDPAHTGARLSDHNDNQSLFSGTLEVPCMTLDTLLKEVDHVDFMKIDVEGHELNILESYSFRVKPKMLKVEHKHVDDIKLRSLLEGHGYMVWTEADDIYAIC